MDIKNYNPAKLLLLLVMLTAGSLHAQKVVRYDLYVKDTLVNYAGKEKRAIAVNGQIPMPTLTFTEGDIAEIVVHNQLKESTSLHWHGVFLPNKEDGVPLSYAGAYSSRSCIYLSFSNHSEWYTLVSFAFRFAGTDWNVW